MKSTTLKMFLALFFAGITARAETQTFEASVTGTPSSRQGTLELGAAGGFPVLGGLVLGYWGHRKVPLMGRLSVGIGAEADIGVMLNPSDKLKMYAAVSGGFLPFSGTFDGTYGFVGPTFGARYYGFWIQAGPDICFLSGGSPALSFSGVGVFFHGQVGYSFYL